MEEKRIYEAASTGNLQLLLDLHRQDQFLLDRVSYTSPNNTPLHIAAIKNHQTLVEKILQINPNLAEQLNSQQQAPLHIAAAKGHLQMVIKLLEAAPDMCSSRDHQGRNPVHLAAIKGHVQVVRELARGDPAAAWEKVDGGLTVMHLCVKYGHFDALKALVMARELKGMVRIMNDDGETILDMANAGGQLQLIQFLKPHSITNMKQKKSNPEWLTKKRDTIMVVAILIATIAFQVGVSPPGGLWQDDSKDIAKPYKAGESIMAHNHHRAFKSFVKSNTTCFVSSLSTILLLISGLPFRHKIFLWTLMVIMWLTITTVAVTFAISVVTVTPKKDKDTLRNVIVTAVLVWTCVLGILLIGNMVRLIDNWLKRKKEVDVWRSVTNLVKGNHRNVAEEELHA